MQDQSGNIFGHKSQGGTCGMGWKLGHWRRGRGLGEAAVEKGVDMYVQPRGGGLLSDK